MNLITCRLVGIVSVLAIILMGNSCGTRIHRSELKQDYNFASKREIGIYTIPSGRPDLDETYSNVLKLDFISKGYNIKDINWLLLTNSDSIVGTKHKKIVDSLRQREYLNSIDVFIISRLDWDSVFVATQLEERIDRIYKGYNVLELTTDLVIFDRELKDPIFSFSAVDTAKLFYPRNKDYYIIMERDWMIAGRQLMENLNQLPICSNSLNMDTTKKLKVSFWADK